MKNKTTNSKIIISELGGVCALIVGNKDIKATINVAIEQILVARFGSWKNMNKLITAKNTTGRSIETKKGFECLNKGNTKQAYRKPSIEGIILD